MGWVSRSRIETVTVGAVVLSLAVLGLVHDGIPAAEVDLNDGGVWVTNGSQNLVGHFNAKSRTLDGGLRATTADFDVSQDGYDVLMTDPSSLQPIDVSQVATTGQAFVEGLETSHGGAMVLLADADKGSVWVTDTEGAASFAVTAEPNLTEVDSPRVVAGSQGVGFVVAADGAVTKVTYEDTPVLEDFGSLDEALPEDAQLSVVGEDLVVFDAAAGVIETLGSRTEVPADEDAVLQPASAQSDRVVFATSSQLVSVPLGGGDVTTTDVAEGSPSAPVNVAGCAYGAWSGSGALVIDCVDESQNVSETYPELAGSEQPVFRVNRDEVILNDMASGAIYLPKEDMERVDNWDLVKSQLEEKDKQEGEESDETDQTMVLDDPDQQTPPEANDDEFGARSGGSATLPVLLNDLDIDGDVLTAVLKDTPDDVAVSLAKDGRAVRVEVPADYSGSFSFTYQASDGKDLSNVASVKVNTKSAETNTAPERRRNNTVSVAERATTSYAVLPDWVDPEGDPLFLESATAEDGLAVTYRQDGYVSIRDLGTGGPGRRVVALVVSDGTQSTTGELIVQVSPGATNHPPVANGDHVVMNLGESADVEPLLNDTDPDGDELQLSVVGDAPPETSISADYVQGSFRFEAAKAGSYEISYTVTDGPKASNGRVRIDVNDPEEASDKPSAEDDLALLPASSFTVVDVLGNDYDPAGGVLIVQNVSFDADSGVSVEVVNHARLRVESPTGLEEPTPVNYTISNGKESASATVLVIPKNPVATVQPPVATDDETVVRANDIVTLDVLANDYSPSDLDITVDPTLEVRSEENLGSVFVSEDKLRFKANGEAGQAQIVYTVRDSDGNVASALATISIRAFDDQNQQPAPQMVTSRTFSGMDVRVPIPTDGIDPDGDSVELLGVGETGPTMGSITVEGNYLVYEAGEEASGTDTFSYKVRDRFGAEGTGVLRMGIAPPPSENQAPVAVPDDITARPNTELEIPVVRNDVDPDGDEISIVADTIKEVDDEKWLRDAKIVGQKVSLLTPENAGVYQLYYDITDSGGAPVTGVATLTVDPDAPPLAPTARDDYVAVSELEGESEVTVDVLVNDEDLDGRAEDLQIEVAEPARVENGQVIVPLADDRQVVLYTITDADEETGKAAVVVPGADQIPPYLDPDKIPVTVKGGETLTVDFDEMVITRPDHDAMLTSVESVVAGPGGKEDAENLGLEVVDDKTIKFTPDELFIGQTSLTFEVTDGDTLEDPRGLIATLSVPITVESSGKFPPELRPSEVKVEPGEDPLTVSLAAMVDDPDEGDNEKMQYRVVSTTGDVTATIDGQSVGVSVPADKPVGSTGTIVVEVDDTTTDPQEMTLPVTVISSSRPLMTVSDIVENEARVGEPETFNLADYITNPFADQGGEITVVGQPSVSGPASASVSGLNLTVTPSDIASDMVVTYVVQDATGDASRQRTGTVRMTVKDDPEAPTNVSAKATASKTAVVTFTQGHNRGGSLEKFTVKWAGGSQDCGTQTSCQVTGLTNARNYSFTVTQTTEVGESPPSAGSNQVWVDVRPNTPAAPTTKFGDKQIELSWPTTTVPDGGSPVTEYTVEISPAAGGTTQKKVSGTSMTWTGLTNGTSYRFRIQASNKHEDPSEWGSYSTPTIPAGAPSNIAAPTVNKDKAAAGVTPAPRCLGTHQPTPTVIPASNTKCGKPALAKCCVPAQQPAAPSP